VLIAICFVTISFKRFFSWLKYCIFKFEIYF